MTVAMQPIQTPAEIFADLLAIQQANTPKPKGPQINLRRHKKAQARSGLMNHVHSNPNPNRPGRSTRTAQPKTRY